MSTVRIGCGSSCESCRIEEAARLLIEGRLDYLCFDRLSERTTAEMLAARHDGSRAFCRELELYTGRLMPLAIAAGTRLVTNAGGEDPAGALTNALEVMRSADHSDRSVAALIPRTDVLSVVERIDPIIVETGRPYRDLPGEPLGASAYYSSRGIAEALEQGADLVICGRVGDSAVYMAPLAHEFGWSWNDWDRLARGIGAGHLMECGPHLTGGYYAAPPQKVVPDLARLGLPYAEVDPDGNATYTKLPTTGGKVTAPIVCEQLLYEVGDPASYLHTDVTVDLTTARVMDVGRDRVRVEQISGRPKPDSIKVLIAMRDGYVGRCFASFAGSDAYPRALLAAETMLERAELMGLRLLDFHASYLGINALFPSRPSHGPMPREVTAHIAARFAAREEAELFVSDCQIGAGNCWGPAGGTTGRLPMTVEDMPAIYTSYLDASLIEDPELVLETP